MLVEGYQHWVGCIPENRPIHVSSEDLTERSAPPPLKNVGLAKSSRSYFPNCVVRKTGRLNQHSLKTMCEDMAPAGVSQSLLQNSCRRTGAWGTPPILKVLIAQFRTAVHFRIGPKLNPNPSTHQDVAGQADNTFCELARHSQNFSLGTSTHQLSHLLLFLETEKPVYCTWVVRGIAEYVRFHFQRPPPDVSYTYVGP